MKTLLADITTLQVDAGVKKTTPLVARRRLCSALI
jgi:hypothetical protein